MIVNNQKQIDFINEKLDRIEKRDADLKQQLDQILVLLKEK